ncbi:hypothetical protein SUGI_0425560 [Cryptomeria japonica]|nr:hypothetical protein SUGI_0425560 [Cryptomeria japonica]
MEKQKANVSNITKSLKRLVLINIFAGGPCAWLPVPPGRVKAASKATVAIRTSLTDMRFEFHPMVVLEVEPSSNIFLTTSC